MVRKKEVSYVIKSVNNAFDLLEEFKGDRDELGVTELSNRLNLHKNNIFRLLATLETKGYIEQNKATENYRLCVKSLELGQAFIKQQGLVRPLKLYVLIQRKQKNIEIIDIQVKMNMHVLCVEIYVP